MPDFDGFTQDTLDWLADLEDPEHQHKAWFDANRDRYEACWLQPGLALIEALGARLAPGAPGLHAVPAQTRGSLFRIHRDTRFSKDKRPYKDHLDVWLWAGDGPSRRCPGLGVRLTARDLQFGGGLHGFDKAALAAWRAAVADDASGDALVRAIAGATELGAAVSGDQLTRPPRGVDPEHPRVDLLRRKALWVGWTAPHGALVHGPGLIDHLATRLERAWPVVAWLRDHLPTGG